MANHGSFAGTPKTEWMFNASGEDRDMRMIEDFSFTDPSGRVWPAPAGSIINGASIPRSLWAVIGSPYTGDYRRASVIHDVACNTSGVDRKDADVMFFHACQAGGCSSEQARILYAGVRIGAWASDNLPGTSRSKNKILLRDKLDVQLSEDVFLQSKLAEIAESMRSLPEDPTIAQMDAAIGQHLKVK